jgi:sulfotransferase family protein
VSQVTTDTPAAAAHRIRPHGDTLAAHHPEPVFLLCPARSCSTVSVAIMAGHPEIHGFPELLAFAGKLQPRTAGTLLSAPATRPDLPELSGKPIQTGLTGLLRSLAEVHERSQGQQALERAYQWLKVRKDWTTVELMDHLIAAVAPQIALEQSPATVLTDASLAACLASYPRARFIHLTRHPVSSQASMHRHWATRYRDRAELVAQSASAWYLSHLRISRLLAGLPPEQWIRARAEDLVNEPYVQLPRILNWLGLTCTSEIIAGMRQTENWIYVGRGHLGLARGDPTFLESPRLRGVMLPEDIRFDPSWRLPREACRRMQSLGESLGY